MSDLSEEAKKIAEAYDQGMKVRSEIEELETENYDVDKEELLTYMEVKGIDSPKEAYAKLYDLEPVEVQESKDEPPPPITDFHELREKAHGYMEQRREESKNVPSTEVTGITDIDELRDKMKEALNERSEERG